MVETGLRWLARRIDAGPRRIAIACLIAAALAAIAVSGLPLKTDILDVLPERNPSITAFKDFLRDFGMMDGLVIIVETEERSADSLIGMVETLAEQLSVSPLVASVDYNLLRSGSRLVMQHFPIYLDERGISQLADRLSPEGIRRQIRKNRDALLSPFSSPFEAEMIGRDPLHIRGIVRDSLIGRLPAKGLDLSTGYYLDPSHRLAFLMVRPRGSARDMAFVGTLQTEVERIAARAIEENGHPRGIKIGLAGGYARAAEAATTVWKDMVFSFVTSFLLVLLLLYFAFRLTLVVLGIFVVTLSAALAWTLFLAYLLYGTLNIVTSIVAAMLIGLFVDYMIHTYRRFAECCQAGGDPRQALERTLAGTGKAILSGSLTTALSFFAVVVTSFRGLQELGVVAGFGILFCLLATLFLMAPLLSWLARSHPALLASGRPADLGAGWAARLVERRGRVVIVSFAALLSLAIAGATRVRFDASVDSLGLKESAVRMVERRIEKTLGRRGEPLFLVARAPGEEQLSADFDVLERQGREWRRAGRVGSFSSSGMLLPPPSLQREARRRLSVAGLSGRYTGPGLAKRIREEISGQGMVADASLDPYAEGIAAALAFGDIVGLADLSRSGDPRAAYFHNAARRAIAAHLTPPGPRWDQPTVSALEEEVRRLGPDFTLIGPILIFDELRLTILWEAGLAALLTFAANLLIVRIHFRSWRSVLLVMLPMTAGTVLTVGAMGISGLWFNFFNVAGIALIFGFGVDYGIYLMQAHAEAGPASGSNAVRATGGNVVLCAITTVASCGSLITTHYRGLASIGAVLSLGALFCLLTSLLLLPALLPNPGRAVRQP